MHYLYIKDHRSARTNSEPYREGGAIRGSCSRSRRTRRACSSARSPSGRHRNRGISPTTTTTTTREVGKSRRRGEAVLAPPPTSSIRGWSSDFLLLQAAVSVTRTKETLLSRPPTDVTEAEQTAVRKLCVSPQRRRPRVQKARLKIIPRLKSVEKISRSELTLNRILELRR